jgi:DNA-binding MarR family transcriptional regulator
MSKPYYAIDSLETERSVGFLIKRCAVLMTQIADREFAHQPVNLTQWQLLICLLKGTHRSPTEISEHLGHDMGALTRVADELERKGLVRRERSQEDRRAVQIAITPEGKRLALAGKRILMQLLNELLEPYSKSEVDALIAMLQGLRSHMESVIEAAQAAEAAVPRTARAARSKSARRSLE